MGRDIRGTQEEHRMRMVTDAKLMHEIKSGEKQTITDYDGNKLVVISESNFLDLVDRVDFLEALEAAGVDNWSGMEEAHAIYRGDDD